LNSKSALPIRLLCYDGQGYYLAQKRLSKGRFTWWPESTSAAKQLVMMNLCLPKRILCSQAGTSAENTRKTGGRTRNRYRVFGRSSFAGAKLDFCSLNRLDVREHLLEFRQVGRRLI
jgi:hypothetical protein